MNQLSLVDAYRMIPAAPFLCFFCLEIAGVSREEEYLTLAVMHGTLLPLRANDHHSKELCHGVWTIGLAVAVK